MTAPTMMIEGLPCAFRRPAKAIQMGFFATRDLRGCPSAPANPIVLNAETRRPARGGRAWNGMLDIADWKLKVGCSEMHFLKLFS